MDTPGTVCTGAPGTNVVSRGKKKSRSETKEEKNEKETASHVGGAEPSPEGDIPLNMYKPPVEQVPPPRFQRFLHCVGIGNPLQIDRMNTIERQQVTHRGSRQQNPVGERAEEEGLRVMNLSHCFPSVGRAKRVV